MKEITIEKIIKETRYEAVDGILFRDKEECRKYEESAKCVLLDRYKPLVVKNVSEYDICKAGEEDYMVDIVRINNEKDIDTIIQLYALYHPHSSYIHYDSKYRDMCIKALQENDYIFIGREDCYGDDVFCPLYSKNDLINNIISTCDGQASK